MIVKSYEEWNNLEQLVIPVFKSTNDKGVVYKVRKVGFFNNNGQPLPTITIIRNKNEYLLRLPLELTEWAFNCVTLAHSGMNAFPSDVEFGVLDNSYYAEIL